VDETFTGFPPSGIAFLAGLAADNTKAYFDGNRDTYSNDVAVPLRALVVAVGQRLRDETGRDATSSPRSASPCSGSTATLASQPTRLRTIRRSMPSGGPGSTMPAARLPAGRAAGTTELLRERPATG
jgi:hypothetical protein